MKKLNEPAEMNMSTSPCPAPTGRMPITSAFPFWQLTLTGLRRPLTDPAVEGPENMSVELPGCWLPQSTVPEIDRTAPSVDDGLPGRGGTSLSVASSLAPAAGSKPVTPMPLKSRSRYCDPDPM